MTVQEVGDAKAVQPGILVTIPFGSCVDWRFGTESERLSPVKAQRFVSAVEKEILRRAAEFKNRTFKTVYFGGSSPSVLTLEQLYRLIQALFDNLTIQPEEQTLVGESGTLNPGKAKVIKESGFDRFELRLQKWSDGAEADFRLLREAGFPTVGVELAYCLDPKTWEQWLDRLMRLQPDHVTLYFPKRGGDPLAMLASYRLARSRLGEAMTNYGLHHYARPGHECRYLRSLWSNCLLLGFGPAAITRTKAGLGVNPTRLADYLTLVAQNQEKLPNPCDDVQELCNDLIQLAGISIRHVTHAQMRQLVGSGLMEKKGYKLFLTDQGVLALDRVMAVLRG
ncbi:MAG: hypothetical protein ABIK44_06430 [candidate division WOR-3 bacterium]